MIDNFARLYKQLNTEQRQAVDTIDGPVMVVAGPGTGKTHVLTMRIASILAKTDTTPAGILALTFTDAAAVHMRERLEKIIGRDAYYVTISTFHAFCSSIITMHPEYFSFDAQSVVLSDIEQLQIIREILKELEIEALKPKVAYDYWAKQIKTSISQFKREGVTASAFKQLVVSDQSNSLTDESDAQAVGEAKRQHKLADLAVIYSSYEQRLQASHRFDYDDLIMSVREALVSSPDLLSTIQEQYLYILVDEYQDTNSAQNEIVRSVSSFWGDQANICVVGDPHQSIFRFQGASLINTVSFLHWYPTAELITLTQGYRCTPAMYQLAHHSISQSPPRPIIALSKDNQEKLEIALSTRLDSQQSEISSIPFITTQNRAQQFSAVVVAVSTVLQSGASAEEIAVLVKTNQDVLACASYFESEGIPHQVSTVRDALGAPVVNQLITLIELCIFSRNGNEVSQLLFDVLSLPWLKLDSLTVFSLARLAGKLHRSLWEICQAGVTLNETENLKLSSTHLLAIQSQIAAFSEWSVLETQLPIDHWLRHILQESGLMDVVLEAKNLQFQTDQLIALKALMEWVRSSAESSNPTLRAVDVLSLIETMRSQHLAIPMLEQSVSTGKVTISTVHKAKGMEWEHVFVLDLVDKKWGNAQQRSRLPYPASLLGSQENPEEHMSDKERLTQDDRRLFYVATTRAKKSLSLYSFASDNQGGTLKNSMPSIFISELQHLKMSGSNTPLLQQIQLPASQETEAVENTHMLGPRSTTSSDHLSEYLRQVLSTFSLSITSLNNYLKSPKLFLVSNLLQLPAEKNPSLVLGTVVHEGLKQWFESLISGSADRNTQLGVSAAEKVRQQLPYRSDASRWAVHATDVLDRYVEMSRSDDVSRIDRQEYSIGMGKRSAFIDGIALKGRLDRVDWTDAKRSSYLVVDYKTGTPKTIGEITANTITAKKNLSQRELALPSELQGSYYRQLVFYSLLGSLDRSLQHPISEGEFDFVEAPARNGKRTIRHFAIPKNDIELLKEVILSTMKEINTLSFIEEILAENDVVNWYAAIQNETEDTL